MIVKHCCLLFTEITRIIISIQVFRLISDRCLTTLGRIYSSLLYHSLVNFQNPQMCSSLCQDPLIFFQWPCHVKLPRSQFRSPSQSDGCTRPQPSSDIRVTITTDLSVPTPSPVQLAGRGAPSHPSVNQYHVSENFSEHLISFTRLILPVPKQK